MHNLQKRNTKKKIILWFFILLWMGVIFLFSAQDSEASSQLSSGILRRFILVFLPDRLGQNVQFVQSLSFLIRKCAHMTEYAILAVLLLGQIRLYGWLGKGLRQAALAIIIVFLYAATDEFHQLFISGRSGQFTDVLIDTCGGLIGSLLFFAVVKIRHKRTK